MSRTIGSYSNVMRDRDIVSKIRKGSTDKELTVEYGLSLRSIRMIRRTAGIYLTPPRIKNGMP